jgi:hypothetical protein
MGREVRDSIQNSNTDEAQANHEHLLVAFNDAGPNKKSTQTAPDESPLALGWGGDVITYNWANAHKGQLESPSEAMASSDNSSYDKQSAGLNEVLSKKVADPDARESFKKYMGEFEDKAAQEHLGKDEVARTYAQLSRILEADTSGPINQGRLLQLSRQILRHAADPTGVAQGEHQTCQTTQLECLLYETDPSAVAKTIADVVTSGRVATESGKPVVIDDRSLAPDKESAADWVFDGTRDYASQLFQVGAINAFWQGSKYYYGYHSETMTSNLGIFTIEGFQKLDVKPGAVRYLNRSQPYRTNKGGNIYEELIKSDKVKGTVDMLLDAKDSVVDSPELGGSDLNRMYSELTGKQIPDFVYGHSGRTDCHQTFRNEEQLRNLLQKRANGPRMIFDIYTGNEPLLSRENQIVAEGGRKPTNGWHAVGVTAYYPETDEVQLDNTWDRNNPILGDEKMKVHDFYQLTVPEKKKR